MTINPIAFDDKAGRRIVITSDGSAVGDLLLEFLCKAVRGQGGDDNGDRVR